MNISTGYAAPVLTTNQAHKTTRIELQINFAAAQLALFGRRMRVWFQESNQPRNRPNRLKTTMPRTI